MKYKIEFDETEQDRMQLALEAQEIAAAVWEFYNVSLRNRLKYNADELNDSQQELLQKIREEFVSSFSEIKSELF